ncbi:MAG: Hpt domain-containing protein [Bacteroidota bacterium]
MNKLTMDGTTLNHHFINLSYLDLMADGDLQMKKLMLQMLLKEIPSELNKMQQLYQEHNWSDLRRASHKMKTTLSFVGNQALSDANHSIEYITKREEDLEQLPDFFGILRELSPKILRELRSVYEYCCRSASEDRQF